ncbi:hypothetical protein GN956_G21513 [Arapaima gigas]
MISGIFTVQLPSVVPCASPLLPLRRTDPQLTIAVGGTSPDRTPFVRRGTPLSAILSAPRTPHALFLPLGQVKTAGSDDGCTSPPSVHPIGLVRARFSEALSLKEGQAGLQHQTKLQGHLTNQGTGGSPHPIP